MSDQTKKNGLTQTWKKNCRPGSGLSKSGLFQPLPTMSCSPINQYANIRKSSTSWFNLFVSIPCLLNYTIAFSKNMKSLKPHKLIQTEIIFQLCFKISRNNINVGEGIDHKFIITRQPKILPILFMIWYISINNIVFEKLVWLEEVLPTKEEKKPVIVLKNVTNTNKTRLTQIAPSMFSLIHLQQVLF